MSGWPFALPAVFLAALVVLFIAGGKKNESGLFRQALPQLLLLIFLSIAISLAGSAWLRNFPYSRRLLFFLWLLFWFFLLILAVRVLAYFVFDYLLLGKRRVGYPKLVKDVVVFILFIAGVLLIVRYYLHQDLTVLLASSAVLTVVAGFALQDVLGNFFSGIILNFEDSFKLGDWVRIGEREGRVEQFGWRSFKIRTIDRELIVIPNQSASKAEVLIYGAGRSPVLLNVQVGAGYHDSPDRVSDAILKALGTMPDLRTDPPPVVQLAGFGDFALNYVVKFWIDDYSRHNFIASDVRRRIWYAFRREGVEIPFPKRDVYLKQERSEDLAPDQVAAVLRRNDVLAAIGEADFEALVEAAERRVFGAGETVIREGDEGANFYHIHSGTMNVVKGGRIVAKLGAGDFFGEISLVTGEKTNATVVAERESVVLTVASTSFRQIVDMNEEMALKLAEIIARRQEETRAFSEKNQVVDGAALKKDSRNLLARILKYFSGNK